MCPRGRSGGQGRPRGLHLCYVQFRVLQEITDTSDNSYVNNILSIDGQVNAKR